MSLQNELDRLETLGRNPQVTSEQRQEARDAWDKINNDLILAAWARIEARTGEYDVLISRLAAVIDNISANKLTSTMGDVTSILNDVKNATSV